MSMCGHHMTPKHHQTTLAPSNTLYMHATMCLDAWSGVCVSMVACGQVETGHMYPKSDICIYGNIVFFHVLVWGKDGNRALEVGVFIEDPPNQCQCVGSSPRGTRWRWFEVVKVVPKKVRVTLSKFVGQPHPNFFPQKVTFQYMEKTNLPHIIISIW